MTGMRRPDRGDERPGARQFKPVGQPPAQDALPAWLGLLTATAPFAGDDQHEADAAGGRLGQTSLDQRMGGIFTMAVEV